MSPDYEAGLLDGKNEGFVEGYAVGHRDGEYLTLTKLAQELIDRAKDPRFSQDIAALRIQENLREGVIE